MVNSSLIAFIKSQKKRDYRSYLYYGVNSRIAQEFLRLLITNTNRKLCAATREVNLTKMATDSAISAAQIENVRCQFLAIAEQCKEDFDECDIERIKSNDWQVRRITNS